MTALVQKIGTGIHAPDFRLPNQNEEIVSLKNFSGKWLVLFFYPRDNTPSCARFIKHFSDHIEEFEKLQAAVVGISRNTVKSHVNFIQKHDLQCMLLSDTERDAIKKYNAWGIKRTDDAKFVGVKRTTYIIDPNGIIRHRFTDVKIATHANEVLEHLQKLQKEGTSNR
ncbi:MAG: peroxiredoxin [Caldisericia bacterium]|nr:peroxiredoxin [Caldisericia bacterium]MDD4614898.1 peroxiredoxin [Caldisericia bacterium]